MLVVLGLDIKGKQELWSGQVPTHAVEAWPMGNYLHLLFDPLVDPIALQSSTLLGFPGDKSAGMIRLPHLIVYGRTYSRSRL